MKKIGFIGVGVMGKAMVRNLAAKGFEVSIYTRTKSKVEDLIAEGFAWHPTIAQCATAQDAVITMLGYPKDVEQVYFQPQGILDAVKPGTYLIDMTTTDPELAIKIADCAADKGLSALDAPVSGGDSGAQAGTLTIMVGGAQQAYQACLPVFEAMGKTIAYTGAAGSGQHTKMANQIALAGVISGVCESMAYAKAHGLDVSGTLGCISSGAAGSWQMSNTAPRILQGDLNPGFFIKHYVKDLNIALSQAHAVGLELEVAGKVRDIYAQMQAQDQGDLGTQALILHYNTKSE